MIVLRLAQGVQKHFAARRSEWALAFGLTGWGYVVAKPSILFTTVPAYSYMAQMASEATWGRGALIIGMLRILALIINGTFPGTIYGEYSPAVRGVFSFASCFVWASITIGLFASTADAPGSFIYLFVCFCLDFTNGYSAMQDFGRVRGAKKNGIA